MNTKMFYSMYNAVHKPKSYNQYIGKKYQYGDQIITITGIYDNNYFKTTSNVGSQEICYAIDDFLSDIKDGVFKEIR